MVNVGLALLPDKVERAVTAKLKKVAADHEINFVHIDPHKVLEGQGPFDCILHKLTDHVAGWDDKLLEYSAKFPDTLVIDPPVNIARLDDRARMFETFPKEGIEVKGDRTVVFHAPSQLCITSGLAADKLKEAVEAEGMAPPLLVKTVPSHGPDSTHQLVLVRTWPELLPAVAKLQDTGDFMPVVLQQYVPHSGLLHKIYVLGDTVMTERRPSLTTDSVKAKTGEDVEPQVLSKISAVKSDEIVDDDVDVAVWKELSDKLLECLGLTLINYDAVCADKKEGAEDDTLHCYIVDINYLPGYEKLPDYEQVFVTFLKKLVSK